MKLVKLLVNPKVCSPTYSKGYYPISNNERTLLFRCQFYVIKLGKQCVCIPLVYLVRDLSMSPIWVIAVDAIAFLDSSLYSLTSESKPFHFTVLLCCVHRNCCPQIPQVSAPNNFRMTKKLAWLQTEWCCNMGKYPYSIDVSISWPNFFAQISLIDKWYQNALVQLATNWKVLGIPDESDNVRPSSL